MWCYFNKWNGISDRTFNIRKFKKWRELQAFGSTGMYACKSEC